MTLPYPQQLHYGSELASLFLISDVTGKISSLALVQLYSSYIIVFISLIWPFGCSAVVPILALSSSLTCKFTSCTNRSSHISTVISSIGGLDWKRGMSLDLGESLLKLVYYPIIQMISHLASATCTGKKLWVGWPPLVSKIGPDRSF